MCWPFVVAVRYIMAWYPVVTSVQIRAFEGASS